MEKKLSVEECAKKAFEDIPYEVGRGSEVTAKRRKRIKELLRQNGHPVHGRTTYRHVDRKYVYSGDNSPDWDPYGLKDDA